MSEKQREPVTITLPWAEWDRIWIDIEDNDPLWADHFDAMETISSALYGRSDQEEGAEHE